MDEEEVVEDCHRLFLEEFWKAQPRKLESAPRFEPMV
jgi:hypothetical protein